MTVLFADICGSSEHAERLDAEEYAELLGRFRVLARDIVPRHGGSIARLQGDGLLALFGHQSADENDARHAAEAALELHAAIATLRVGTGASATAMALHSGIHSGLVLLIEGDIERGRYDVVGEVPNTAARLCGMAGLGEVLISVESLGPLASHFEIQHRGHLNIRGRSDPLQALLVLGKVKVVRRIDAAARRGAVGFVGRSAAMRSLQSAAAEAAVGSVTVVLRGEPGIGKTRTLDEFLRTLSGPAWCVLRGTCEQGLGVEPLQPFMQMLRSRVNGLAGSTASAGALRPLEALEHLLDALMPDAVPVLAIDDWHWADDATRQLLPRLRAKTRRLLVILATRPGPDEDTALPDASVLDLQPLVEEDASHAIEAWLPGSNAFVQQEIYRQSGGSPLFIEELCHVAAAGRELRAAHLPRGVAWLNALVASRVESLPPELADVLCTASVVGPYFEVWVIQRLLGEPAAEPLLKLQELDFLVSGEHQGQLRFKHVLTRDAVYATVSLELRRSLHREVARLLVMPDAADAPERLEALAYHYNAAGMSEEGADCAERAGDKALAAMALDRARMHYRTALLALDTLPLASSAMRARWCAIAQRLGQTCVFDALDVGSCLPLFKRAASIAADLADDDAQARAHYWLGYVMYGKGEPRRSVAHCQAARRHAEAGTDVRLQAQIGATLGQALASAGRYDEALPLMRQSVESKRLQSRPGSGTAIGSAYTLARTGFTLGDQGQFDAAQDCFDEALKLLGDSPHAVKASVLELLGAVHLWQGRWSEARAAALAGAEVALRCRSRFNTEMGRALAACAGWAADGDATALLTLREATQWIEAQGGAISMSLNYGWLVEAAVVQGQRADARRQAARLRMRARAQDTQGEAQGLRALAQLAALEQDRGLAERWLALAERSGARRGSVREAAMTELALGRVAARFGDRPAAAACAQRAQQAFAAMAMLAHAIQASMLLEQLEGAPQAQG